MEVYIEKQSMLFFGTFQELKEWLRSFPEEWTFEELLKSHLH